MKININAICEKILGVFVFCGQSPYIKVAAHVRGVEEICDAYFHLRGTELIFQPVKSP